MDDLSDYKPLYLPEYEHLRLKPCPACGSKAQLFGVWPQVKEYVICCTHGEALGNQDPNFVPGCPMYLPRREFHQDSIEGAVEFWNSFAEGLVDLRRRNEDA